MKYWMSIALSLALLGGCEQEEETPLSPMADATLESDVSEDEEPEIPQPPVGATYTINLDTAEWVKPANGADLVALSGLEYGGFLSVEATDNDQFTFMLVVASETGQDFCSRTLSVPEIGLNEDGNFVYGPTTLALSNGTLIEETHLTGHFNADFSSLDNLRLSGRIDLDTFDASLLPEGFEGDLCELLPAFLQIDCVPCEDGRVRCVESDVTQPSNPVAEDLIAEPVTLANCHAQCTENLEDCSL